MGFYYFSRSRDSTCFKIETTDALSVSQFAACKNETSKKALIVGIYYDYEILAKDKDLRPLLNNLQLLSISSGVYANAFLLDDEFSVDIQDFGTLVSQITKTECVKDVVHIEPRTEISNTSSWIFLPSALRPAEENSSPSKPLKALPMLQNGTL